MKCKGKNLVILLTLILAVPLLWLQWKAEAYAAAPALNTKEVEITGQGGTYQLAVKNKAAKCKYKWSTSDMGIARVSSKGLVTAMGKGTATIKCKITYPTKKTKTLACKVTVTIVAKEIRINNASEVDGAHKLLIGSQFDFNVDMVPINSSYSTYWYIGTGDKDCIRLDDNVNGVVTGLKKGTVILNVKAVKNPQVPDAESSAVSDSIIIEVAEPTATVQSADITGINEIRVVFDSPMDKSTLIGTDNKLLDNIAVTMGKNSKDPGDLTASLSADLKTLTITSANIFSGTYGINITSKVKTAGGIAIEETYKPMTYTDKTPPAIEQTVLDDSGMIATINFSEPVDFTNFKVSNATQATSNSYGLAADKNTLSILNNPSNYIINTDKKSVTINLTKISTLDYGKTFMVIISGIKDLSGNYPLNYTLSACVYTNVTKREQARPITIIRTAYNTITATFTRAIQIAGYAYINNGSLMNGVVDTTDPRKVNYTLSDTEAELTGIQNVYIGFWESYNVLSTDTYSQKYYNFTVPFIQDKTSPVLNSFAYDTDTGILTLTYNENVTLSAATGVFSCTITSITDEITSGNLVTYSKLASTDNSVIKLQLGNIKNVGSYSFTIDKGFVADGYKNPCLSRSITINSSSSGTEKVLSAPTFVGQSSTNLSQIYVDFASMLDAASATNINNYTIPGVTILTAQLTKNTKDSGSEVLLTIADGSVEITLERPITISGIKGYNGTYGEMKPYSTTVILKDNKKPSYISPPVFDSTQKNIIRLNFSEEITGSMVVTVNQMVGNSSVLYKNKVTVSGSSVVITLEGFPANNYLLKIDILSNSITDLNGNESQTIPPTLGVVATYQ